MRPFRKIKQRIFVFFNFLLFHTLLPADLFPPPSPFPALLTASFIHFTITIRMAQCKGPRTLSPLAVLPADTSLHGAAAAYLAGAANGAAWSGVASSPWSLPSGCGVFSNCFPVKVAFSLQQRQLFPLPLADELEWTAGFSVKAQCLCENRSEVIRLVTMCHYLWSQPFANFPFIYAV